MAMGNDTVAVELGEDAPLLGSRSSRPMAGKSCSGLADLAAKLALLVMLVCGSAIGGYLIHEQNTVYVSETFDLVTRDSWHADDAIPRGPLFNQSRISHIVIFHTRGPQCQNFTQCVQILQDMQLAANTSTGTDIPFNFLIGGDGLTYEARGWHRQSAVREVPAATSLTIAFIGEFSEQSPAERMLREADVLLHIAENQGRLAANWRAYGVRYLAERPDNGMALFRALAKRWARWDAPIDVI